MGEGTASNDQSHTSRDPAIVGPGPIRRPTWSSWATAGFGFGVAGSMGVHTRLRHNVGRGPRVVGRGSLAGRFRGQPAAASSKSAVTRQPASSRCNDAAPAHPVSAGIEDGSVSRIISCVIIPTAMRGKRPNPRPVRLDSLVASGRANGRVQTRRQPRVKGPVLARSGRYDTTFWLA